MGGKSREIKILRIPHVQSLVKVEINAQLEQCQDAGQGTFTPKICSFIRTEEGRQKIEQIIINYVAEGMTIAEAIIEIERDYNDNLAES